jgi:hypothetical protein
VPIEEEEEEDISDGKINFSSWLQTSHDANSHTSQDTSSQKRKRAVRNIVSQFT